MAITISADDPRTIRAIEIAAEADQWLRWRTADGHQAYGVPSQTRADQYYIVTLSTCDCPDFRRNALRDAPESHVSDDDELYACKHILAVRLHDELVRAQEHEPARSAARRRGHLRLLPHA
jgi:hypothetical protein